MDVKFPLDNYRRAVEADDEEGRRRLEALFTRDVRQHVAAVAGRGYADPALGTVDFALLFVPSDALFVAIIDLAPELIDHAARQSVVVVGPSTLFALLRCLRLLDGEARLATAGRECCPGDGRLPQGLDALRRARRPDRAAARGDAGRAAQLQWQLRRATVDRAVADVEAVLDGGVPPTPPDQTPPDSHATQTSGRSRRRQRSGGGEKRQLVGWQALISE
jgi:hypothetical protein